MNATTSNKPSRQIPPLGPDLRRRISRAIDLLIEALDRDDALDPANECEGQELFDPARGWTAIDPDLEADPAERAF